MEVYYFRKQATRHYGTYHIQARVADMSELLGRQDCIESLHRDLVDLQGVIVDVFSRTGPNHMSTSPTNNTLWHPEADSQTVGCQTIESSLIPCDACHRVQSLLRKTGDALVELFQSEGLPSSLQPLSAAVEDTLELGQMTAGDVAQWANEQVRDMRRLAKHLQDVRGTVRPLKDRLETAETERERFRSQLEKARKDFKREMEKHQATIVQLEFSLHKAQRSMKETEQRLLEEQHQLKTECEKKALQEKVESLQLEEEASCKLQQRIQQLEREISETQVLLDKEKAKYQSACRLQESMQAKQKSLLERVNALDEECEELQMQLGEREERQIELHSKLQQTSEEREQLQAQLAQQQDMRLELQKEKQALETNTGNLKNGVAELKEYVQALKERERLLVAFPELSPLAQAQPQSTGNVLLDMEQQLQANSIRIKVLEQENATLQTSLEKLKERAQHNAAREAWALQTTPVEKQQNHLTLMQSSPLQSSSATRLGYSNSQRDARAGESGWESAESEDRVSTAAASPLSLQIHLQTLHLNTPRSTAAKSYSETRSAFLLSHSRGLNKRRK
ncbi:hypothetical protein INR49_025673 [Caranx melampygus]|nr:hypothetical protein INR49_025673 [Caranx melampygus]